MQSTKDEMTSLGTSTSCRARKRPAPCYARLWPGARRCPARRIPRAAVRISLLLLLLLREPAAGLWPAQVGADALLHAPPAAVAAQHAAFRRVWHSDVYGVDVGLGRIVTLYYHSTTSYLIH